MAINSVIEDVFLISWALTPDTMYAIDKWSIFWDKIYNHKYEKNTLLLVQ